jgi:putrescine aminotransferase
VSLPALLHPFAPPGREAYLSIARGEGVWVEDTSGRRYIDAMASLWYCNVGHGHPAVVAAIAEQASRLACYHAFAPFTNPPSDALAEALRARAPMPGARVFLTSSGSEAVDSAIKIARIAHERAGEGQRDVILSRSSGYHGVTMGGTASQGLPPNQEGFGPHVPGIHQVPQHDLDALRETVRAHHGRVAAILAEPVQCAGGVHPPAPGYLEGLRALCDEEGCFLIFDEVVTGFGRLGTWFAGQAFGVRPDMVTFAKAVTSGYVPLGGVLVGEAVRAPLERDPGWMLRHGHTYSGHPLAAAAALACLAVTESEGLLARAPVIGARLEAGLAHLVASGHVRELRRQGAVLGLELAGGRDASGPRDAALERGVIVRPIGATVALCPPLIIRDAEIDAVVEAVSDAILTTGDAR